jgi:NhaP-type Na+/H+ or K+/H+ antiporter
VFAGILGSKDLFAVTCLVVLLSVVLHGGGIALYLRKQTQKTQGRKDAETQEEPSARPPHRAIARSPDRPSASPPDRPIARSPDRPIAEKITLDEVRQLIKSGAPMELLDVRTERSYRDDNLKAKGAIRMPPDDAVRIAREIGLSHHSTLVLYCA